MIHQIKKILLEHWPLLITMAVLSLLLLRNPFSNRTLIPNFEPFPDSFHYIVPPRCFLQGQGWKLCRDELQGVNPAVPPVYGVVLLPAYILFSDSRSFYFINVILAITSLTLLYLLVKKISRNQLVQLLVCFILATTYQVYWIPTLAMAENLLLPILLGIFYLISFKKLETYKIVGISMLAGLLYGSKFAGLPLLASICGVLAVRILFEHFEYKSSVAETSKKLLAASLPVVVFFLLFGGWRTVNSALNLQSFLQSSATNTNQTNTTSSWFSLEYFSTNIAFYMQTARGESTRFLWDLTPLVGTWMAVLGWFGLGYGLSLKRWRWLSATAVISALLQAVILATFYTADTRYIYNLLPTILLGMVFFFTWLKHFLSAFSTKRTKLLLGIICLCILSLYSFHHFPRLKSQAAINLKYAETPWWYLAIEEMNTFITQYNQENPQSKKPIIISPMVPYLVDLYSTANFSLLPLDQNQDFRGNKNQVWGDNDYSNLLKLYQQKIELGHPVFVAKYGIGNEKPKQNSFAEIEEFFELTEVHDGCFDQCDIYQLSLIPEDQK